MTLQALAHTLTKAERGLQQVNIAQMHEVLKCLKRLLSSQVGMEVLKALLK